MQQLLTTKQVAELLNCAPSTIYDWAQKSKIPSYKMCGSVRFDATEVKEWINNSKTRPAPPLKITPQGPSSGGVDDLVQRAIASVTEPSYNIGKGKLGLDKAQKKGDS